MKTLKSLFAYFAISAIAISCRKSEEIIAPQIIEEEATSSILGTLTGVLNPVSFCAYKTVPLCAGQNINIGTVTVKTGSDGNIYVTYKTKSNWYLKELHLFAGQFNNLPVSGGGNPIPGQYPYHKYFSSPYNVQEYTFKLEDVYMLSVISAHAAVVKRNNGNGNIIQEETAWGDGCTGTQVNPSGGSWGTYFEYNVGECMPEPICSYEAEYFYENTLSAQNSVWPDVNGIAYGLVTVGGSDYTEGEARDIYNTADPYGIMPHSKKAFIAFSTLKLSQTYYAIVPELVVACTTVEANLALYGKLSPTNLPSNNPLLSQAADVINNWIGANTCPDRR